MDSVGEGEGGEIWENSIETCNIHETRFMYETSCQSRFDTRYWMLGASALGRPRGMVWGGRRVQMGNAGIPMADSFRYLAKLIQYCKV